MLTSSVLQVLPAASDSSTFYLSMQPFTAGKTTADYVSPVLTFVPATSVLYLNNIPVLTSVTTSTLTINNGTTTTSNNIGALVVNGGVGVSDSVYVGNRIGFSNTSTLGITSVVYQVFNPTANSIDTIFG